MAYQSTYSECLFLDCVLPESCTQQLDKTNLIFPKLDAPFDIYRSYLYSANSLYSGFDPRDESSIENTYDRRVYKHFLQSGVISKNIKEKSGMTFGDILKKVRMKKARAMLKSSSATVESIAESVGYQNVEHFNRIFKKMYNITPVQYRNRK